MISSSSFPCLKLTSVSFHRMHPASPRAPAELPQEHGRPPDPLRVQHGGVIPADPGPPDRAALPPGRQAGLHDELRRDEARFQNEPPESDG